MTVKTQISPGPRERHQAILIRLMRNQRKTAVAEAMMAEAAAALAQDLGADCAGFFQLAGEDALESGPSWSGGTLTPFGTRWPAENIGAGYLLQLRTGRALAIADTARDPNAAGLGLGNAGVRAVIMVPVIRGERWGAGLYVHHSVPREWNADEIAFVQDVAEITWDAVDQGRATAAIRESETLFREIADVAPVLIWMSDSTKACVWFNKPWLDFTGRTMEQELGYGWAEGVHPGDFDRCVATYNEAFDRREPFRMDYRLRRYDGVYRIVNDIGVQRFSSDGKFLGYIGSCLDVTDQRLAVEALRGSELRYRQLVEQMTDAIFVADAHGRFVETSAAGCGMLGMTREEVLSSSLTDIIIPEEHHRIAPEIARFDDGGIYTSEWRVRRKDGSVFIGEVVARKLANGNLQGVVRDISERKRHDDQIRLLMREVNHRSKNMLTLVQAIARQTLAANPDDFLDRFGKRVEALAANQDLLLKNAWKWVDLNELVRSQLAPFGDLIGTRIELRGSPFCVCASAAQAIGMALHELATNAGKYGALSDTDGRVEINWSIRRDNGEEEAFYISWREQCAQPISAPLRYGFGSSVIGSMAELSLSAKVELEYPAAGIIWQLRCPVSEVMDNGLRPGPRAQKSSGSGGPPMRNRPRILIVEDEVLVAVEIAHVLTGAGFEIVGPARSVAAALELLKQHSCDAAVLDINLGSETSEAIALNLTASGTPFVTLSGYTRDDHRSVFAAAPALTKPLRPGLLIAELRKCIQNKGQASLQRAESA
jgi:PAS domain S-box-containing protein